MRSRVLRVLHPAYFPLLKPSVPSAEQRESDTGEKLYVGMLNIAKMTDCWISIFFEIKKLQFNCQKKSYFSTGPLPDHLPKTSTNRHFPAEVGGVLVHRPPPSTQTSVPSDKWIVPRPHVGGPPLKWWSSPLPAKSAQSVPPQTASSSYWSSSGWGKPNISLV